MLLGTPVIGGPRELEGSRDERHPRRCSASVPRGDYPLMWWLLLAIGTVAAVIVIAIWGRDLIRQPPAEAGAGSYDRQRGLALQLT
jgi:hypothetical protein